MLDGGEASMGDAARAALALALHHRPGAYALLLGSGLSTAAGIPTGWQVVEHLIGELATARGVETDDPVAWYRTTIEREVTYSRVIASMGLTEAERQALVVDALTRGSGTFPAPTAAHRAVAELVAGGAVSVVLTTNFDPLLEVALAEAGVSVTVLSTPDQVAGALPLVHLGPVVVKLHGDHRDHRIRNTEAELRRYPPAVKRLLDRVLRDYGLVVCGWSAEHDVGLCEAIERTSDRRFTTYWCARGGRLNDTSRALATRREAEVIPIEDADGFFGGLVDSVRSLRDLDHTATEDPSVVVATIKRQLAGHEVAIPVHDRIRSEIDRVRTIGESIDPGLASHERELARLGGELRMLTAMVSAAAYWGDGRSDAWWLDEIPRFARRREVSAASNLLDLPRVPGLVMAWSAGVAAVARQRHDLVRRLFALPTVRGPLTNEEMRPLLLLEPGLLHVAHPERWLYHELRRAFVDDLHLGRLAFGDAFERWQYLMAIFAGVHGRPVAARGVRIDGDHPGIPVPHGWLVDEVQELAEDHPLLGVDPSAASAGRLMEVIGAVATLTLDRATDADGSLIGPGGGWAPTGRHYPGSFTDDPDVFHEWSPEAGHPDR